MILNCGNAVNSIKGRIALYPKGKKVGIINVGNNPSSKSYIYSKQAMGIDTNIPCIIKHFDEDANEGDIGSCIIGMNNNPSIGGIILQLPLPKHLNAVKLINMISPHKDIDCLTSYNMGRLMNNNYVIAPCTPTGIIELLKYHEFPLKGKDVLIINRSEIVGKPLAHLFLNEDATVIIAHSKTKNLKDKIKAADIIVTAVGKKNFISYSLLKELDDMKDDKIIIDVGINKVDDSDPTSKKICGDVQYNCTSDIDKIDKLKHVYVTPVPKGIGPLTVVSLFLNTILLNHKSRS